MNCVGSMAFAFEDDVFTKAFARLGLGVSDSQIDQNEGIFLLGTADKKGTVTVRYNCYSDKAAADKAFASGVKSIPGGIWAQPLFLCGENSAWAAQARDWNFIVKGNTVVFSIQGSEVVPEIAKQLADSLIQILSPAKPAEASPSQGK